MTTDGQDDVRLSTEQLDAFLAIVRPGYRTFFRSSLQLKASPPRSAGRSRAPDERCVAASRLRCDARGRGAVHQQARAHGRRRPELVAHW